MNKQITSIQNPLIKEILQLQEKSRSRKKSELFVIEGVREIGLAIKGGYQIKKLLCNTEIISEAVQEDLKVQTSLDTELIKITSEVYQKIAYRTSTEGVIAVAKTKDLSIKNLNLNAKNPLILIAESPEKPGNIGALLRTADAAHLDAVIIANPKTDMYNPNIIRSSVGGLFTNNIATGTTADILAFLKEKNVNVFAAILQEAVDYDQCDYKQPSALVVGAEDTGLSQEWRDNSFQTIKIPMLGEIDSMNVSVAAGILIFEAKRQRRFN